jgi:hypothetical protein
VRALQLRATRVQPATGTRPNPRSDRSHEIPGTERKR